MAIEARWICCQIGARERYSLPRALHRAGELQRLVTDAWVQPDSRLHAWTGLQRLGDRFHPDLQTASVQAFTLDLIRLEAMLRIRRQDAWTAILRRNQWFQRRAIAHLQTLPPDRNDASTILFSYSYAALELARFAKRRGWRLVLGQMDPGPVAEQRWQQAPDAYWADWREECALADRILVNSAWAEQSLRAAGIPPQKLAIAPLAYEPSPPTTEFHRQYPTKFSPERPLRVLFLGQAIARKGIQALLQAAISLRAYPIEFWIVGAADPALVATYPYPTIRWVGAVPHSATAPYYQGADIFLFPTHSDGFGLTQLEAQSWQLPLITSRFCGSVAKDQVNGWILPEVTPEAIAHRLLIGLRHPEILAHLSAQSGIAPEFTLSHLHQTLHHLFP